MSMVSVSYCAEPTERRQIEEGLEEVIYRFSGREKAVISLHFPYTDCAGVWHPRCGLNRSNDCDWDAPLVTTTSRSAPVVSVFSDNGTNRCTVALSETLETVKIHAGIREEDGMFHISVELPPAKYAAGTSCEISLWVDRRPVSFSRAVSAVSRWWEDTCGMTPMDVPEEARLPMYSTWYSYHQMLNEKTLEEECRWAAEAGFTTVIVDDGWQTGDNNRGYAYCGDWQVCPEKISDMARHVKRVHDLGMKYMLWYSVPFMGKHAEKWSLFQDKLLNFDEELGAGVLDPRYPQVREYLVMTYRDAVERFDLDGLKLDFIDRFMENDTTPGFREGMDYTALQPAVDRLMVDVAAALKAVRPHIMIEFRQTYIGPNIRKYGNIFRVCDCPASGIRNRVGTVDLRLLSGHTAVHSDMLMWHENEAPEEIARQIIACIFSTVQISVLLEKLDPRQRKTLLYWLNFMKAHRRLLLETPLEACEPHNLYPEVRVSDGNETLVAIYGQKRVVHLEKGQKLTVVNGTKGTVVYVETAEAMEVEVTSSDCCGDILYHQKTHLVAGPHRIPASSGGVVLLS